MLLLESAIKNQNLSQVMKLLVESPNCIDDMTTAGIPMSFYAAQCGNEEIMRYIVEYSRASFNSFDFRHRSVLHYAVESGNVSLVRYLVEKVGLSPLEGDVDLITPLDLAVKNQAFDMISYFEHNIGCSYDSLYRNPILSGMHPDPSIVRVGEDYYMVNSSFIFFPCIPISHSKDLIHWEVIGHAITNPAWARLDELEGGRGYWAPDISYHKGRFYITATYRLNDTGTVYRKQMVTSSDFPQGPYCEPVFLDEDGIDPSIFTDDDGKRYMLLNRGARLFEISEDGTKQLTKAVLLYYGSQKRAPEGSHLLKKDGYYYLFQAEGGTGPGHRITVARSKELFGNYEPCPYNPIMRQWDETAPLNRCGHGKPIMTQNGEWFMVYLCARMIDSKYSMLGRETAMDPITWTLDGWPIVNSLKGPSVLQKKPNLPKYHIPNAVETDDNWMYSNEWVSPRPCEPDGVIRNFDGICIQGSKASISTMYARNLMLRRQTKFNFSFEASMKHTELSLGQNTGLTCYYDENTYLLFGLSMTEHGVVLRVMEHVDTTDTFSLQLTDLPASFDKLKLRIVTQGLKRTFYYQFDDAKECLLGALDHVYYLCDEGIKKGKRFTGAMYGLYAYAGNDGPRMSVLFTEFRTE